MANSANLPRYPIGTDQIERDRPTRAHTRSSGLNSASQRRLKRSEPSSFQRSSTGAIARPSDSKGARPLKSDIERRGSTRENPKLQNGSARSPEPTRIRRQHLPAPIERANNRRLPARRKPRTVAKPAARTQIRLENRFPLSPLYSLRKNFLQLVGLTIFWIALLGFSSSLNLDTGHPFHNLAILLGKVWVVVLAASMIYWEIYRKKFSYQVDGKHTRFTRGVIFPRKEIVPLASGNFIRVNQRLVDSLFGMREVTIFTSSDPSSRAGIIEGLSKKTAEDLSLSLLDLHG